MFCAKCGCKNNDGINYCNKCGNPVNQGVEINKQNINKKPLIPVKYIVTPIIAVLVIIITIFVIPSKSPDIDKASMEKAINKYFSEYTDVLAGNQSYYQECFNYTIDSAFETLSTKSADYGINSDDINAISSSFSSYFSNESNLVKLVDSVKSRSSYDIVNIEQQKNNCVVTVSVNALNINNINTKVWDEIFTVRSVGDTLLNMIDRGVKGGIIDLLRGATGDMSFYLDEFVNQSSKFRSDNTYNGKIEFSYNKDTDTWEISDFDKKLISAYYGVIK